MSHQDNLKNLETVFERLLNMAREDEGDAEIICESMDDYLDELQGNDFFGTESQMDPRGDFRDGDQWSLSRGEIQD